MPDIYSTSQKGRKCVSTLWRAFKVHIGPILAFIAFTFAGGALFENLEGPAEIEAIRTVNHTKHSFLMSLYDVARSDNLTYPEWLDYAKKKLEDFENLRMNSLQPIFPLTGTEDDKVWTLWGALLYCGTIYTTIGKSFY